MERDPDLKRLLRAQLEDEGWEVRDAARGTEALEILGAESVDLILAGLELEVLHVPGHSPDSVCFYSREHGQLFGGDVLISIVSKLFAHISLIADCEKVNGGRVPPRSSPKNEDCELAPSMLNEFWIARAPMLRPPRPSAT